MWGRKEQAPTQLAKHRGRIYRSGWGWRYKCTDCDFGAGTVGEGTSAVPLYIGYATEHARQYGPSLSSSSPNT